MQKTIVTLIDDLTGEQAENIAMVEFTLDGATYQIDLTEGNAAELRNTLAVYVSAARRTGGRRRRQQGRTSTSTRVASTVASSSTGYNRETLKAIRGWAKQNGHAVNDRGRLPATIIEAWEQSHDATRSSAKTPAFSG